MTVEQRKLEIQAVIDRLINYPEVYIEELKKLNDKYPVKENKLKPPVRVQLMDWLKLEEKGIEVN